MTDTQLLDWLESRFKGTWRESIFIGNEIGGSMLVADFRNERGVCHRAKTVRGLLRLAIKHEEETK